MSGNKALNFAEVSLEKGGVVPVTKAAARLADITKKSVERPTVLTQNGVPIGVILSVELFSEMRDLARQQLECMALKSVVQENEADTTKNPPADPRNP